ncbi:unnamed protein product [Bursaphelenchus okinawaensis]|uniref:SSD domain-containing protein n=1 Tax=Bursaphelenchus okinawaensis TaxID=465554 RepID=A0A811K813_9BILA|nr:unnamed protein product [Bursaphelenchus okinawaensis]CAG9093535.1 unnamed protein product [Bursaphelenchus okinawaensis]
MNESADSENPHLRKRKGRIHQAICDKVVGKSDSAKFSEVWKQNFMHHPSWCDADMCLQQIEAGNATGNTIALYSRSFFQQCLYYMGAFVQKNPKKIVFAGLVVFAFLMFGLRYVVIETDIVKLWVSQGGRLDEELNYLGKIRSEYHKVHKRAADLGSPIKPNVTMKKKPDIKIEAPEIPSGNGLGGGFQVLIQTPKIKGRNLLNKEGLLSHVQIMQEVSQYKVNMYGESWSLSDICFKPPAPKLPAGTLNGAIETLLEKIIPCIWITPIDCYWEGAKPLGPDPPLVLGEEITTFINSLPKGNITWKNLDPGKVVKEVSQLLELGLVENFFERAGIGSAYLDRPCIDPLDPECPTEAPNHFDKCKAFEKFTTWNNALPGSDKIKLEEAVAYNNTGGKNENEIDLVGQLFGGRKKRATTNATTSDDYYDSESDYATENSKNEKKEDPKAALCQKYGNSFLRWMDKNQNRWKMFLEAEDFPKYPDYGQVMTGGCLGFGKNIMKWPEDLIIGGVRHNEQKVTEAAAFQSVFLVAGAGDVYNRFRAAKGNLKPNLDRSSFTIAQANDIVQTWQRNFTKRIYDHKLNLEDSIRTLHPLASTSVADMLEEFSQFKFFVIFIGYVLMIIYAGYSQCRFDGFWFSVDSSCQLAVVGVLLITYSSIGGLGFSTLLGINFNAATTQIVPFLTLGLGIDDMFLLLHNYNGVLQSVKTKEVAILMKETGMSILITSTNNILAFTTGIILPIPALRSFCLQTAILLSFNLFTIMIMYPALISLDIKRRKKGIRDMTFCCGQKQKKQLRPEESSNQLVRPVNAEKKAAEFTVPPESKVPDHKWYTLEGFMMGYYIPLLRRPMAKVFILLMCLAMFVFGCVGLYRSRIGLELADVLPENTAPSAFLKAREEYFSFYPMFAVLRGEVDYANQQAKIEQLRLDIAKSDFIIKVDGHPSEPYWMMMMRVWLHSIQKELDKGIKEKFIDPVTGNFTWNDRRVTDDMRLARRLLCSYGNKFNCTGRIGVVKLIESDDTINPEGFYNYLTGWFNIDNMMYYVSQAAFFPSPPRWGFSPKEDGIVPPAPRLLYSQIPFYGTHLTDTPVIVEMIREIRAICEKYTAEGLPVFPSGIAFTFWEQYLHLSFFLFLAIVVIATAVLFVISLIVFNPWAAAMVAIVVVSMTVELAGFMGLVGVKLNPISAVTLVTAVGIGVEFTAHVVLAFLTSLGTRDERMVSCMEHMFIPVIHGGLSTLLGIVMLAFSEFEFVVVYFFVVMSALIVIGMINGLAMLPVLLSLIGPPCEVVPRGGGKVLAVPPPLNKKRKDKMPLAEKKDESSTSSSASSSAETNSNYHEHLATIDEECQTESNPPSSVNKKDSQKDETADSNSVQQRF